MKQNPAAQAIELLGLVEQLADAVWMPKEVIDRAVRSIRGELTPGETGRPTRQKWMRDRVQIVPGRGRVVDRRRERPLTEAQAYERVSPLPLEVAVDMFVEAVGDRAQAALPHKPQVRDGIVQLWKRAGERYDPNVSDQIRRRFFQRLIAIGERALGVGLKQRRAAARLRRQPPPQARRRKQQRELVLEWVAANCSIDRAAVLTQSDLTADMSRWWAAKCTGVPMPSAKVVSAAIGTVAKKKTTGKHHDVVFIGVKLRPAEAESRQENPLAKTPRDGGEPIGSAGREADPKGSPTVVPRKVALASVVP